MDIRETAVKIYKNTLEGKGCDLVAEPQDRAFVKRLLLTALRRQEFLRKIIAGYSAKKLPQKMSFAQLAIILGAVEILYFSTPEYAVVNSYVALAKKLENKYCGGFVNAILRKICADCKKIINMQQVPFFPSSFRRILSADYTQSEVTAIEKTAMLEPLLDITVKNNAEKWAEKLAGKLMPNGSVRLKDAGIINDLAGYDDGQWWVQDMASSLAVQSLGDIRGKKVLDLCAAPGGKTAQLINAGAEVTAVDISEKRLQTLKENLQRLNLAAKEIVCADALDFLQNNKEQFDIILLDAPCSATGTLRRHPEIVHTRTTKDIEQCAELQKKMLNAVAPHITKGGILLYAVCSLSKTEGEKQIETFVAENNQFKIEVINPQTIAGERKNEILSLVTPEGFLRCLPSHLKNDGGMDGFFIAKLKKE